MKTLQSNSVLDCGIHAAGLVLNSEGLLIDEKTGEVINEFGATRFDIAVHGNPPIAVFPAEVLLQPVIISSLHSS